MQWDCSTCSIVSTFGTFLSNRRFIFEQHGTVVGALWDCGTCSIVSTSYTGSGQTVNCTTLPNNDSAIYVYFWKSFWATEYINDVGGLVLVVVIDGFVNVAYRHKIFGVAPHAPLYIISSWQISRAAVWLIGLVLTFLVSKAQNVRWSCVLWNSLRKSNSSAQGETSSALYFCCFCSQGCCQLNCWKLNPSLPVINAW